MIRFNEIMEREYDVEKWGYDFLNDIEPRAIREHLEKDADYSQIEGYSNQQECIERLNRIFYSTHNLNFERIDKQLRIEALERIRQDRLTIIECYMKPALEGQLEREEIKDAHNDPEIPRMQFDKKTENIRKL
jgi:hypothetical protein